MKHIYRDERGRFTRDPYECEEIMMREDIEHEAYLAALDEKGHVHPNIRLNQPCPACEKRKEAP